MPNWYYDRTSGKTNDWQAESYDWEKISVIRNGQQEKINPEETVL